MKRATFLAKTITPFPIFPYPNHQETNTTDIAKDFYNSLRNSHTFSNVIMPTMKFNQIYKKPRFLKQMNSAFFLTNFTTPFQYHQKINSQTGWINKITSNNRDTHVPVSINKDINSVLEDLVIRDKCCNILKHNPWHHKHIF